MSSRLVSRKKRKVIKFDDRFFNTSIEIIQKLSDDSHVGHGVNDIIKQTSSDRSYIINLIRALIKAGLLIKINNGVGVVNPVKLTEFGSELKKLKSQIDNYVLSASKLAKSYKENIEIYWNETYIADQHGNLIEPPGISTRRMKTHGWKEEEINDFMKKWDPGLEFIEKFCFRDAFSVLIYRYTSMANKFNPTDIALKLLTKIILNGLEQYVGAVYRNKFENFKTIQVDHVNSELFDRLGKRPFDNLRFLYTDGHDISSFRLIHDEIRNFASSLLDLIYPPEQFVALQKSHLEYEKKDIFGRDSSLRNQSKILKDYDELISLIGSYQNKWNLRDELFEEFNELERTH